MKSLLRRFKRAWQAFWADDEQETAEARRKQHWDEMLKWNNPKLLEANQFYVEPPREGDAYTAGMARWSEML